MMMTETKTDPYESASSADKTAGKREEMPAAIRTTILRRVSAKTCYNQH
jgi:hypothetical protein